MSCDIGRGEPKLRVGGGDPRFGGFDVLGGGGLLGPQALGFALRLGCDALAAWPPRLRLRIVRRAPAEARYRAERPRAAPARLRRRARARR